jgi:hypothetical protein
MYHMGAWRVTLTVYLICRFGKLVIKVVPYETLVRRRSSQRSSSVAQSLQIERTTVVRTIHGIALFHEKRVFFRAHSACVFQQWNLGFHRYKPGFLSYAIARIGAYFLVKPVIPGVAFIR